MAVRGQHGGDRVLESRHLVGLFLGVVLLCGVFFTLGYVMGRNQFGGPVHAEDTHLRETPSPAAAPASKSRRPEAKQSDPASSSSNSSEWDFYGKAAAKNSESETSGAGPAKSHPVYNPTTARFQPPKLGKNAIVLQVSAITRQSDALAMADAIQQKGFPAFVLTPTTDSFYRVQVGPYADEKSASAGKHALEEAGFKSII